MEMDPQGDAIVSSTNAASVQEEKADLQENQGIRMRFSYLIPYIFWDLKKAMLSNSAQIYFIFSGNLLRLTFICASRSYGYLMIISIPWFVWFVIRMIHDSHASWIV